MFTDKKNDLIKYCEKYKDTLAKVDLFWDGGEKENSSLIAILAATNTPCNCCTSTNIFPQFDYSEILYILAKFF